MRRWGAGGGRSRGVGSAGTERLFLVRVLLTWKWGKGESFQGKKIKWSLKERVVFGDGSLNCFEGNIRETSETMERIWVFINA